MNNAAAAAKAVETVPAANDTPAIQAANDTGVTSHCLCPPPVTTYSVLEVLQAVEDLKTLPIAIRLVSGVESICLLVSNSEELNRRLLNVAARRQNAPKTNIVAITNFADLVELYNQAKRLGLELKFSQVAIADPVFGWSDYHSGLSSLAKPPDTDYCSFLLNYIWGRQKSWPQVLFFGDAVPKYFMS